MLDIKAEFSQLLDDIENEMRSILDERQGVARPLYDMLAYHLGLDLDARRRGKRLRPLLGLLAYQALSGEYQKALPGAAAVELGHNFSLVHDDIEDLDRQRHHRPTLWALWGIPMAINAGDTLFALSRMALYRLPREGVDNEKVLDLLRVYDETCLALCEGQYLDISFEQRIDVQVDEYLEMASKKTAALISAAVQAGAMVATDDRETIEAFRRFGHHLGLAFQMADDLLGAFGSNDRTGKREAGDVAKRKKTLPVVWALQHAPPDDRERLREIYSAGLEAADGDGAARDTDGVRALGDAQVEEVLTILERCGARDFAAGEARRYRDLAVADLLALPLPAERQQQLERFVAAIIAA